ncbi:MAG: hypothetical protein HKL81_01990 [Acidimicrobiaceae bacterium]|nr:hypothetical protein [Acidimicrobiaceae bacterium]
MVTSTSEGVSQVDTKKKRFLAGGALMAIWGAIAVVILGSFIFLVLSSTTASSDAQRVVRLEGEFKCPSCIDLSVAESSAASSISIKTFIKNEVAQGVSDAQIKDQLVASYGNSILFTPPKSGAYLVIWALPIGLVLLLAFFSLRSMLSQKDAALARGVGNLEDAVGEDENLSALGVSGDLNLSSIPLGDAISSNKTRAISDTRPDRPAISRSFSRSLRRATSSTKRRYLALFGAIFCIAGVGLGVYSFEQSRSQAANLSLESRELSQAIGYTYSGQDVSALRLLSLVLRQDPYQPQALAYQGWLLFQAGVKTKAPTLVQKGEQLVLEAIAIQPHYADAHGFLSMIDLYIYHETTQAKKQFNEFLADSPSSTIRTDLSAAYKAALSAIPGQSAKPTTVP